MSKAADAGGIGTKEFADIYMYITDETNRDKAVRLGRAVLKGDPHHTMTSFLMASTQYISTWFFTNHGERIKRMNISSFAELAERATEHLR